MQFERRAASLGLGSYLSRSRSHPPVVGRSLLASNSASNHPLPLLLPHRHPRRSTARVPLSSSVLNRLHFNTAAIVAAVGDSDCRL